VGTTIEADYLVVGAGAMGLAFTDTLVSETDAPVVVVDRNDQPGGDWTSAYPFVRLHQPSATYSDDDTKNTFCNPMPYPRVPADWLRMMLAFNKNQVQWFSAPDMMAWVDAGRAPA
jgi:cation diffusion facilitator CzcD-associated flavoprotein CzcO